MVGVGAYLDAFSDYMNPLLGEMDKAEKMLSNLKVVLKEDAWLFICLFFRTPNNL